MPVGKELGAFDGKFSSIRVVEVGEGTRVLEGIYSAAMTGNMKGVAKGTITFDGRTERGVFSDKGVGFFDSGDVANGKGQGVYWSSGGGTWEIRGAFQIGDQMVVSEGQVSMSGDDVLLKGKIFELT